MPSFRFHGRVEKLEIARGHDGFLRGPPDPVLAVAVYVHDASTCRLLGRSLHRFRPSARMPSEVLPDVHPIASGAIDANQDFRYLALVVALEEDGGRDVQRLYGMLEHHRLLSVWDEAHSEVEPFSLLAVPRELAWFTPTPVDLIVDGASASTSCSSDKYIGAVCWAMQPRSDVPTAPLRPSVYRLPFLAADRKNDWTALLSISH
ncbi:MAG: hypothetical protein KF819_38915 [Labilithrix sp.]|nr:hypothetical protein [Labilithrix sp.]